MRVAIVTQPYDGVFPPAQNSIGLILYHTAMHMAKQFDVTVIVKRRPEQPVPRDLPFDVVERDTPFDDKLHELVGNYPNWAERLGLSGLLNQFPSYARKAAAVLRRLEPDIVHIANYWEWCARFAAAAPGGHVVLEMQAEWLSQLPYEKVLKQLSATHAIARVSSHVTDLVRARFPDYAGTYATVFNGVDAEAFVAGQGEPDDGTVLFVGRASPEKGVHTLIEAFATVAQGNPQARLKIAGPLTTLPEDLLVALSDDPKVSALSRFYRIDYHEHLRKLVSDNGLEDRVEFLGSLPHADLIKHYEQATIVVNPSLSETFGIACVEAMAMGKPIIATRVGGMKEIVEDGHTGYLVEAEAPGELADAMSKALGHGVQEMGEAGRRRVEEVFSWPARVDRLAELYRSIVT